MLPRISSGVPGVDSLLNGGLPQNRCIILQGGPGSGKTTFALQFIYDGISRKEEPAIYVTLSESPQEIRENNLESHGWNLSEFEEKGLLSFVDARPVIANRDGFITPNEKLFKGELLPFSHILQLIMKSLHKTKAKRLAFDSLTVLTMQYANRFYVRQGVLGLIQALSELNCTSLLLIEDLAEEKEIPIEMAVAPGAVRLRYEKKGDFMSRSFQILKMRGIKHSLQFYHMEIEDEGIRVFPQEASISR